MVSLFQHYAFCTQKSEKTSEPFEFQHRFSVENPLLEKELVLEMVTVHVDSAFTLYVLPSLIDQIQSTNQYLTNDIVNSSFFKLKNRAVSRVNC